MPSVFEFTIAISVVTLIALAFKAVLIISGDWDRFVDWCWCRDRRSGNRTQTKHHGMPEATTMSPRAARRWVEDHQDLPSAVDRLKRDRGDDDA